MIWSHSFEFCVKTHRDLKHCENVKMLRLKVLESLLLGDGAVEDTGIVAEHLFAVFQCF